MLRDFWLTAELKAHLKLAAPAYDPANPPLYESQASYLLRHDLLLPGERRRLTEGDLDPEAIVLDQPDLLY
jgi:hypothetical protein